MVSSSVVSVVVVMLMIDIEWLIVVGVLNM